MELTMADKRNLIERIINLVENNILKRHDRDGIFQVCLVAYDRELAKLRQEA